jgi:hypothetical protein
MTQLETNMASIRTGLDRLATSISNDVIHKVLLRLQGPDGLITKPNAQISELQDKLLDMIPMMQAAVSAASREPSPASPPRKNQKLDNVQAMDGVNLQSSLLGLLFLRPHRYPAIL